MKKPSKNIRRVLITALFLIGVTVLQFQTSMVSFAAAKTWTGTGGDNKFSTATNWSGNAVPTNGDSILFNTAGLSADTTLLNDITGLSLAGITEYGANQFSYTISGNTMAVAGTVESTATNAAGTTINVLVLNTGLTLSANTTFHNVLVGSGHSVDTQGHNISAVTDDVCGGFGSPIVGNGNLAISGTGTFGGSTGLVSNPSFTGAITVNSGLMVGPNGMFGSTGTGTTVSGTGRVSIYATSNFTGVEPLTLGGTGNLGIQWASQSGCSGDSATIPPYVDSWTAPVTLTSNFLYAGQDHNLTVSGPYTSNGFTFTKATGYNGTITTPAQTTAPGTPTNLVATPSSAQVALSWSAPASDGGVAISDYAIQYKLSSAGSWTTFTHGASTATTATVTGLTNGSSYDFRVAAVNSVGTGSNVTITGVNIAAAATVPSAVTFPSASVNATSHNVVLNWTAPASNGGSAITNYLIEAKLSSASTWSTISHTAFTGTSFEILNGLTDGQTYDFRISPINAQGTGPSAMISNYTYTAGTGSTGSPGSTDNIGNAGGVGTSQTVTAPNTGISPLAMTPLKNLQIKSPFAIVIFGLASVAAVLFVAWPRRTN